MDLVKKILFAMVALLALPGIAQASIDIGGLTFDDLAFADLILSTDYTGDFDGCPGIVPTGLESALLGSNLDGWIDYGPHDFYPGPNGDFNSTAPPTQYIEVAFTDNVAVNLPGPDIAIFQMGGPNAVRVSIDLDSILNPGAVTSTEVVVPTAALPVTSICGTQVNVGYLELDDFGVPRGDSIYHLFLSSPLGVNGEICGPPTGYPDLGVPELAAVGALHSDVKSNDPPLVLDLADGWASAPAASIELRAVARDDGLPAPGVLTCQWISDRGPATTIFDDPNAFETVAHFSAVGRYYLTVEVSDGDLTTTESFSVMVTDVDSEPPAAPTALTATASYSSRIELDWNASEDNVAVAGYEIYRDGLLAGTTAGLSFADTGLPMLTTYDYDVVALDLSGNPSAHSDSATTTTLGYVAEVLIAGAADDAEEENSGTMVLGSGDLDIVNNGAAGDQVVGLRYATVPVPRFATVISAWIEFAADAADSGSTSLLISAEAAGNAAAFTTDAFNLSSRLPTSAQTPWDNVAPWPAEHYFHRSPDISPVVQELIDRPDWTENNAMVFLVSGSGVRRAKPYEGGYLVPPMLHIEYALAPPENQAPAVDAGPDATISLPNAVISLAGVVSDDGLPDGTLDILWSRVSGPGLVTFADRTAAATQAAFYKAGVYVLCLSADDGEFSVSDTVTIHVTPPDLEPPTVPTELTALAFSGFRIDLSWNPSLDNVAVEGYVVYRDGTAVGTTPGTSFSDTGLFALTVYQYSVEAYDPSGNFSGQCASIFAVTLQESYALSIKVAAGIDDAEEGEDGSIQLNSTDLELVDDVGAGNQVVGLRFDGVALPQGAWVTGAWIEFETDEVQSGAASLLFTAEDSGDAVAFTSTAFDISSRPTIAAAVPWDDIPPWDTVDERHTSPDLALIVQDLVDRVDWVSGNAMVFVITGSGVRTAESFNGEPLAAPILHLEYAPGVPVNSAPYVNAGPDATVNLTEMPLQLAGAVFDDGLPFDTLIVDWSQASGPGTAFFSDPGLADADVDFDVPGTYVLQLTADDGEYLTSDTVTVLVTDDDLEPPSIPQNLLARAVQGARVDLTWDASTDNVAVAGYVIYRDGVPYFRTSDTAWSDTELGDAWRYEYAIEAYDQAGNFSGQGDPSTAFIHLLKFELSVEDK